MNTLYSLRTDGSDHRITKFVDGEVESSYLTSRDACECPAGHRSTCRHRQMLPQLLAEGIANTHWFWNFDLHRVVDFDGMLKSNFDALNELANIPGVQVLGINDPAGMHNAIAEAVGEAQHVEGANRTATEIVNTPAPELREPLLEHLVDRTHELVTRKPWRRL